MEYDYRLGRLKGQFVVVWYEGGRRRRYRLGTSDKATARAAMREFARQRERSTAAPRPLSIEAIWRRYLADREAKAKPSVPRMKDAWKALLPTFADLTVADLADDSHVLDYIEARREQGIGNGTIRTELIYLRAAIRKAKNILTIVPEIPMPAKPRPHSGHLTGPQARKLLAAAKSPHVQLYILLALHTAGRPSSILDLTWDRVDFGRGTIQLDNPSRDATHKGRATVPMNDALRQPLIDARHAALTEFVIEWAGKPVASIKKGVQRAAQRACLPSVTPYVLRHTAAVWMAESRVPMSEISQYLGHTSTAVTERVYARYSPDYLRHASQAINTVLLGSTNQTMGEQGERKTAK